MKKKVLSALAIVGIVVVTGCESLQLGGLSDTLLSLGQTADQAYSQYQLGVAAGKFPPSQEVSEKYAQYKFMFDLLSSVMKPKSAPPAPLIAAKAELDTAITEAKTEAAKSKKAAKKPAPTP